MPDVPEDAEDTSVLPPLEPLGQQDAQKVPDAVETLLNPEHINMKSRIPPEHISLINRLDMFAARYKSSVLGFLSSNMKELLVSEGGKGRLEAVEAAKADALRRDARAHELQDIYSQMQIPRIP